MDRRTFLLTASAGAAAGALPSEALAAPARPGPAVERLGGEADRRLRAFAAGLRRTQARVLHRTLRRQDLSAPDATQEAWARGAAAMAAIERASRLPLADQVHPAVQDAIAGLFDDVADGIVATRLLLEAAAGADEEPDAARIAAVIDGAVERVAEEQELSGTGRALYAGTAAELRARLEEEGLRAVARREARRLARLIDLSARMDAAGVPSGALEPTTPDAADQVAVGEARWSELEPRKARALRTLGIIGCGLGVALGGYLLVVGTVCALACEAPGLLLVGLLGAVIVAASVLGIIALVRAGRRSRRPPPP